MLIFGLRSTSDDQLGWLMESNPFCHPSPPKKIKWLFLDYIQLLMIGQAGWWTRTPSTTPLQQTTWNARFWIAFNFWWSAGQVHGLERHLPLLSIQKNKMLVFGLHSTSDDWPSNLSDEHRLKHKKKWKGPPRSSKSKILIFGLCSISDDWPSDPSDKCWPKYQKRPPKSSKNEMFVFGLSSISDDQPSNPSNKSWLKLEKRHPKS